MRSHSLWVLGTFAGVLLAGCATSTSSRYQSSALATEPEEAQLMSYRLASWSAPDDHTLIFQARDGTRYRAETLGPCFGLDYAPSIGFSNRGGFDHIDRFTSVVLPDGTRCQIQSFHKVVSPATRALDSFEKLSEQQGESKPTP